MDSQDWQRTPYLSTHASRRRPDRRHQVLLETRSIAALREEIGVLVGAFPGAMSSRPFFAEKRREGQFTDFGMTKRSARSV